jgi:hypothetical protein
MRDSTQARGRDTFIFIALSVNLRQEIRSQLKLVHFISISFLYIELLLYLPFKINLIQTYQKR